MTNEELKNKARILLENFKAKDNVPYWESIRKRLLEYMINRDINSFLHWDIIQETMYVHRTGYIQAELNAVLKDVNFSENLKKGGIISSVGSPISNENHIHMLFHLQQFCNKKGYSYLENCKRVLEFGGGFGNMAYIVSKINPNVEYTIFDFPEFNLLQQWYLEANGITNVKCVSDLTEVKNDPNYNLLIGTWSLSEAPLDFRNTFLNGLNIDSFLIAYQKSFDDPSSFMNINNNDYFASFSEKTHFNYKIEHLFGEQYYLFI